MRQQSVLYCNGKKLNILMVSIKGPYSMTNGRLDESPDFVLKRSVYYFKEHSILKNITNFDILLPVLCSPAKGSSGSSPTPVRLLDRRHLVGYRSIRLPAKYYVKLAVCDPEAEVILLEE